MLQARESTSFDIIIKPGLRTRSHEDGYAMVLDSSNQIIGRRYFSIPLPRHPLVVPQQILLSQTRRTAPLEVLFIEGTVPDAPPTIVFDGPITVTTDGRTEYSWRLTVAMAMAMAMDNVETEPKEAVVKLSWPDLNCDIPILLDFRSPVHPSQFSLPADHGVYPRTLRLYVHPSAACLKVDEVKLSNNGKLLHQTERGDADFIAWIEIELLSPPDGEFLEIRGQSRHGKESVPFSAKVRLVVL